MGVAADPAGIGRGDGVVFDRLCGRVKYQGNEASEMTRKAFDKIKAGLEDAIAFAQGDVGRGIAHVPSEIDARASFKRRTRSVYALIAMLLSGDS
jgi:hypothetical protein